MNLNSNTEHTRAESTLRSYPCRFLVAALTGIAVLFAGTAGCRPTPQSPTIIFLDGAGHAGAGRSVRQGMEAAGYRGRFETFTWSSFLGPGADHLLAARSKLKARQLAKRIAKTRQKNPGEAIHLMGLSAGTALIVSALAQLPDEVEVDNVVLFSSSISANHDLSQALRHVRGRLYAVCSEHDGILSALAINADGQPGPPAGLRGFRLPRSVRARPADAAQYRKVVNLPWQGSYAAFGWHGGHVEATGSKLVRAIVAPRVLSSEPYPLDRPLIVTPPPESPAGHTRRPDADDVPIATEARAPDADAEAELERDGPSQRGML